MIYGFEESTAIRRQELTNHKTEKGTFFERIKLKDSFGFADQEKITYGLGYNLTLKRNTNNDLILRGNAVDAAKVEANDIRLVYSTLCTKFRKPATCQGPNSKLIPNRTALQLKELFLEKMLTPITIGHLN